MGKLESRSLLFCPTPLFFFPVFVCCLRLAIQTPRNNKTLLFFIVLEAGFSQKKIQALFQKSKRSLLFLLVSPSVEWVVPKRGCPAKCNICRAQSGPTKEHQTRKVKEN